MENILKQRNLSETPFRKEVLTVFDRHDHAISLATIESALENYNRITLYRTMKVFVEKGIIHEIAISGQESNYAICQAHCDETAHHHQHIHFQCTECQEVSCVQVAQFPSITLPDYQIDQLEIQATGICFKCKATDM